MRVNADTMLSTKQKEVVMKNYYARVKLEWSQFGLEAKTKQEAVKQLKEIFLQEYGLDLQDSEIVEIGVDK